MLYEESVLLLRSKSLDNPTLYIVNCDVWGNIKVMDLMVRDAM
jgi:hypothetical protein